MLLSQFLTIGNNLFTRSLAAFQSGNLDIRTVKSRRGV